MKVCLLQSLSTLVVSSIFPSGLLNTVNLGHLYYLTLSVIGGQGVKRWITSAGNCENPLPERALFFPIVVSTCLVLCGNNLCVWQRKKGNNKWCSNTAVKDPSAREDSCSCIIYPTGTWTKILFSSLPKLQNDFGACRSCPVVCEISVGLTLLSSLT